jgi:ADP-heptose:LPS heptosyltransferase
VVNRNILIIQLAGLGDACTLIPYAKQLESDGYTLDVAAPSHLMPLWKHFIDVRHFFPIRSGISKAPVNIKQTNRLNHLSYAAVFSTSINPWGAYLASLPVTGRRIGMIENGKHYTGSHLYTHYYHSQSDEHVSSRFFNMFRIFSPDFHKPARPNPESHTDGRILIHPGAKWKLRRWPAERYDALARRLSDRGFSVSILAHRSEPDLTAYFQCRPKNKHIQVVCVRDVEQLVQVVRRCRFFIGNDSGPAHLANLLGKSIVVLWGPGHLNRIRPKGENVTLVVKSMDCRPCKQYADSTRCERGDNACLKQIQVDEVEKIVLDKLDSPVHSDPSE